MYNSIEAANPMGQDLAYDLRQTYAKIVGEHMEDIAIARKADKYDLYFKSLEDLHIIIHHKFKTSKDETDYQELVNGAAGIANKYPDIYLGQAKDPKACAELENALRKVEMFLYSKMQDANMFGANKRIEGL